MIQSLIDGVLVGSVLSLGAIGLTMVMHTLRFANFSHAELLSIGAYVALVFDAIFSAVLQPLQNTIGPFSMTWALAVSIPISLIITGLTAVVIDRLIFKRIRENGEELSMVFASFGVALIIRNIIGLVFCQVASHMPGSVGVHVYRACGQIIAEEQLPSSRFQRIPFIGSR